MGCASADWGAGAQGGIGWVSDDVESLFKSDYSGGMGGIWQMETRQLIANIGRDKL